MTKSLLYFRNLPRALKLRFKARCTASDHAMQDVIRVLMDLYVSDPQTRTSVNATLAAEKGSGK